MFPPLTSSIDLISTFTRLPSAPDREHDLDRVDLWGHGLSEPLVRAHDVEAGDDDEVGQVVAE